MNMQETISARGRSPSAPVQPAITGFLTGTIILTQRGEVAVEDLVAGDKIISRDAGLVLLRGISSTTSRVRTVRVAAGSLGDTRPEEDMDLPADHRILVRDWRAKAVFGASQAMAAIGDLIDGEFITDLGEMDRCLFQLHFDSPHIVYAGGLEVECGPLPATPLQSAA
ncbi:Hint domain-containing protein [Aliisedimentitalea scapharcae]|uniref:Hint domain-containing protein n=1 Tax=Aliisedimentitalea scapharcae TaxID=1524259 RepID=A0ABZ2XXX2_9RHOB